jgi:heavy metal sensor kinase
MHSLRLKLIGWFLLVLLFVIVSFSFLLYFSKQRAVSTSFDSDLMAKAILLSNSLEIEQDNIVLKPNQLLFETPSSPWLYRITADNGGLIAQTDLPAGFLFPVSPAITEKPVFTTVPGPGEHPFRIVFFKTIFREDADVNEFKTTDSNSAQTILVSCAGSLRNIDEELEDLQSRLFLIGLITFLIAGLGGFFLSNRALRPINQISQTVAGISDIHLSERIERAKFDIELHPLITQLNAALDRLETGFQRERQFTADASHELRTPLSVIVNNLEVLLKRPRTVEEHLEVHQSNLQTAYQMQTIIEGLLTLSRIDAGQFIVQKKLVQVYPLIEDIFKLLQAKAMEKQILLANEVETAAQIPADAGQLKQALLNLIENAIIYNRQNGRVTVQSKKDNGTISIKIIDTGIGIIPEHLSRIFDRFYRVDPARTESTGGCGLGLAIARSIIELHQGTISVASSPAGSIFTVMLPLN